MQHYDNFINGKFTPATSKDRIEVTNPSTGAVICTVPESSSGDVDAAISAADTAQTSWPASLPNLFGRCRQPRWQHPHPHCCFPARYRLQRRSKDS